MSLVETTEPTSGTLFDPYEAITQTAKPGWRRSQIAGYLVILGFFGGFGGFAAFAPLKSSVMAPGEVRIDNERKVVQHPDGGVITEILAREGQRVEEGQVLVRLDPTRDTAQEQRLNKRYLGALAEKARLNAERDGAMTIEFPAEVMAQADDPEIVALIENEKALFRSRQEQISGQVQLLLEVVDQTRTVIDSTLEQVESVNKQIELLELELADVRTLYEKGLERRSRVLALERGVIGLAGQRSRLLGDIARQRQRINEMELRASQVENEFQANVISNLNLVTDTIQDTAEQLPVVAGQVERLEIRAPRTGRVVDLRIHTLGGVIRGSEVMMDIVPEDEPLIIVARVKPRDIDELTHGVTKVQVRLTSFSQRFTHPIAAELESVSADSISDTKGGSYYRAVIRLDPTSLENILPGVKLSSGMPALAMIGVGEKTLLAYIMEPLTVSFSMALREP
ncbi:MAG: HlyD family type I secretion periplasmic adaptor subunit [Alphaproteobacteria bacterium]|nr:HlyD family type I secretion periplasmic adaptor subunit [Alphaproteobacteria bacterium]